VLLEALQMSMDVNTVFPPLIKLMLDFIPGVCEKLPVWGYLLFHSMEKA